MKNYRILSAVLSGMLLLSGVNLTTVSAEEVSVPGDINLDGKVSVSDVILMHKYLRNQQTITKEQFESADANQDGKVNVFDLMRLKQMLIQENQEIVPDNPEQEVYIGNIQWMIGGFMDNTSYEPTGVKVIRSAEELADSLFSDRMEDMQNKYTDEYFEDHDLIAISIIDGSLGYQHYVTGIETGQNWNISLVRWSADGAMCDALQDNLVVIETDKSPESAENISVNERDGYGWYFIRTDGYADQEWLSEPTSVVITSREELENYSASHGDRLLNEFFWCKEEFFTEHNLVFAVFSESSGSYRHAVTEYVEDENGLHIEIKRLPISKYQELTCDEAEWHTYFFTDKTITPDTNITVTLGEMDLY